MEQAEKSKLSERIDYKFWTIAIMVLTVLVFNVTERVLLDADEADISYARLIVPANKISNPLPGDVFVFNHQNERFEDSRFCSLQTFSPELPPIEDRLSASNLWGSSVNDTLATVGDYVPQKIASWVTVQSPEKSWTYFKRHRTAVNAPMEPSCLQTVVAASTNPNLTPFVVDSIYEVQDTTGQAKWVRFANPLMIDPATCSDCPQPKTLRDIVQVDPFTRLKAKLNIVTIN
ncbi:hypothetical protein KX928_07745 [Roseobacter sp. YSTF-M11]|uniref:Uncharacterized protein n=1 Tax=Roseobacter insulae TaxID=2859783 RepID=A0A9X1FU41_9RHOB|nr:hypothetical protein [Roseobacter insulae]MBW4707677.1 hypothetical protein [Roseobacter insulae]